MNQKGFSLVEVLIVVALIAIIAAIATRSTNSVRGDQLTSATRQFYADLQKIRQDALTRSTATNSRGFGIRFGSGNSYTSFEYNDADSDYTYDGTGEESGAVTKNLPSSVSVTIGASGDDPTGTANALIFDKRGVTRAPGWTVAGSRSYVLKLEGAVERCVQIDGVSIREGKWNGTSCN